jgi:hypothetical protein
MRRIVLSAFLLLLAAASIQAEPTTNPIRYTWIATSCETWNCAASALVLANGDKYVIPMPTGNAARPWVILRRVEEGSIYVPENEPYACNVHENLTVASAAMAAIDSCHAPMILSVPDGRVVVTSLTNCEAGRRRATH